MRYINRDDLIEIIQERLLDESVQLNGALLDSIEAKAIDFAISYISGRYDCDIIFGDPVRRHGLLAQAIGMIVAYWAVRRNAARKVPGDFPDIYREAVAILEHIRSGSQQLDGMPEITGADGTTASLMYGNNTNRDFFI
ncbi:MAG: DUF1320 domain-containing protein [Bacteroidales bacterium]|jgi:hypothetical protein|nr:DUF1320 domain-containing protein [Bacteroidales bacterium]